MPDDPGTPDDARDGVEAPPQYVDLELAPPRRRAAHDDPDALLTEALAAAQAAFPTIAKAHTAEVRGKEGKPGYTYAYADLADVLAGVRPVLAAHGLAIAQTIEREGNGNVLVTELRHVGGGRLRSELNLGQSTNAPQQFGSALTYLRRYALVTLAGVAAEQDLDAADVDPPASSRPAPPPAPAPALPAWAREATREEKEYALDVLERILGGDRALARGAFMRTRDHLGMLPAGLVALVAQMDAAVPDPDAPPPAPTPPPEEEREPNDLERAAVEQALAAPADDVDVASASDYELRRLVASHPDRGLRERALEELERREAELAQETRADDPGPDPDTLRVDHVQADALPATPPAPSGPAPGSVRVDELPQDPAKQVAVLRAAGCLCDDPLDAANHASECPISTHGIPF